MRSEARTSEARTSEAKMRDNIIVIKKSKKVYGFLKKKLRLYF